jgi:hypothetical protein
VQALVLVLVITNLATLVALVMLWLFHGGSRPEDLDLLAALAAQRSTATGTRRLLSIEILNPVELAGTRGRVVGIAGSLVPALTRRIVYDQTLRLLRKQLVDQGVVADVRLHKISQPVGEPAKPTVATAVPTAAKPTAAKSTAATAVPKAAPPRPPVAAPLTAESELLAVAGAEGETQPESVYLDPYPGAFDPFVADPFQEPIRQEPIRQEPIRQEPSRQEPV